jgi:hypothetical protein
VLLGVSSRLVKKTIVVRGELPRVQVPGLHLNQYIGLIKNLVSLVPAELISNFDYRSTAYVALFQVLDVPLFDRHKLAKQYLARDNNLDTHLDHAFRVFRTHETATTSTTVRSSWEKAVSDL